MRKIMTINPKGGCGKTTLATNIASYFAQEGFNVTLADYDLQQSSMDWLKARPEEYPDIVGVNATEAGTKVPRNTNFLIMDAPAAVHGNDLANMVKKAETLVIPVLPSPVDMRACAHFIKELLTVGKVSRKQTKMVVVANRAREYTIAYHQLEAFLSALKIPFITTLRDSQAYIRAADQGLGIFELPPSSVYTDLEQWDPLVRWLKSKRSIPA